MVTFTFIDLLEVGVVPEKLGIILWKSTFFDSRDLELHTCSFILQQLEQMMNIML